MLGVLRSICKCLKKEEKDTKQKFDDRRKMSLVVKQKPVIEMVEGSLQSTSQQVPEQFRQKVDSDSDTLQQEAAPAGGQFSRQFSNSVKSTATRTVRVDSNASSSSGRKAPPVHAPPAPPPPAMKPTFNTDSHMDEDDDNDDVEIIDNDVYGAV